MTALVVVTLDSAQLVASVVAAAAFLTATAYLFRLLREAVRRLLALNELAEQELTRNHGSSMKDDIHGIAVTVGLLSRDVEDLTKRFNEHIRDKGIPWTP